MWRMMLVISLGVIALAGLVAQTPAAPAATDLLLYVDALTPPWAHEALWKQAPLSTLDFASTEQVHSGSRAIRVNFTGWGGFSLAHNAGAYASAGYTALRFWLHGGASGGQVLAVSLGDNSAGNPEFDWIYLAPYLPGGVTPPNAWTEVTIPLTVLMHDGAATPAQFNRLNIYDGNGGGEATFYLDDISILGTNGPPPTPTPTPTPCPETHRGLWVWNDVVAGNARQALFAFTGQERLNSIYVESESYLRSNAAALGAFTGEATSHGLAVEWLLGYAPWALTPNHADLLGLIDRAVTQTLALPPGSRPTAVHLDVEPHTLPEWQTDPQGTAQQYLALLDAARSRLAASGAGLALVVDMPFWYDGQSVTYNGQTRPLSEHVLNRVDAAVLMDYRDHAWGGNGIVALASSEVTFAGSIGKRVRIGVETNAPDGQPAYITFYEEGRRVMLGELAATRNAYAGAAGFGGVAVHDYDGYANLDRRRGVAPWMPVSWDQAAALASYQANAGALDDILPFQYELSAAADGSLIALAPVDAALISQMHANGHLIFPTITNQFDPARVSTIINSASLRQVHIQTILAQINTWGFDGVDIDYESLYASDRDAFTTFMTELASALHSQGKRVSIAVHPKTSEPGTWSGPQAQDYAALGRVVDRFRIMVYDYHWSSSTAGPLAPLAWAEDVLDFAVSVVDPALIWLGVPLYGYDWVGSSGEGITWTDAMARLAANGATLQWQNAEGSGHVKEPWFSYGAHQVWFFNGLATRHRLRLADAYDIAGIAIWRLGHEDPANWQWMDTWRRFYAQGDLNGDSVTDIVDVQTLAAHWGETAAQPVFDRWYDLDRDGAITVADVIIVAAQW